MTGLTLADERNLRPAYNSVQNSHEQKLMVTQVTMFFGYWPATYLLAR